MVRFFKKLKGPESRTIFVETRLENRSSHLTIDCICVPADFNSTENNDNDQDHHFDLELLIQKTLLEGDSEWNRSTS